MSPARPGSPTKGLPQQQRRSTPRWKRANPWLGKAIPSLLLLFGLKSYKLVVTEIIPLLYRKHRIAGVVYGASIHLLLALTAFSYFKVYFESLDPPKQKEPPELIRAKRTIYACDAVGNPLRCYRDRCNGAWQSIRTRHCRDCGTCRAGFDHHCAFMDNCVSASTFKPFFCFLVYAFFLLLSTLALLAPLQYRVAREVYQQTWRSDLLYRKWWNRKRSWAGGPVYRYVGGLFLGFLHYPTIASDRPLFVEGVTTHVFRQDSLTFAYDVPLYPSLAVPSLNTFLLVGFALMICAIAVAMVLVIYRNSRTGLSAVQLERARRWRLQQLQANPEYDARLRLWVPLPVEECVEGGAVVLVEPGMPLFDLGAEENWTRLVGKRWWDWLLPWAPR
ncbi:hypothetical protein JCM11251_002614 [Rhodosporidiobolus azoricus]